MMDKTRCLLLLTIALICNTMLAQTTSPNSFNYSELTQNIISKYGVFKDVNDSEISYKKPDDTHFEAIIRRVIDSDSCLKLSYAVLDEEWCRTSRVDLLSSLSLIDKVLIFYSDTIVTSKALFTEKYGLIEKKEYIINDKKIQVFSFLFLDSEHTNDLGRLLFYCHDFGVIADYSYVWNNLSLQLKIISDDAINNMYQNLLSQFINDKKFFPSPANTIRIMDSMN